MYNHSSIENKRPTLRDVYRYVVPQYAHKWTYLGAQLHFSQAELEIIFSNSRNDSEECCRGLMSRWLIKSSNATWDQLLSAIDHLPQHSTVPEFTCTGKNEGYMPMCVTCSYEIYGKSLVANIHGF